MANYRVIDEDGIENAEFGFYLEPGYEFADGDFEPDLIANWLAYERVETDALPVPEPEAIDEDE